MKVYINLSGEGLGHASRMVALAKYLEEKGYDIVFGCYGKAINFIKSHGFNKIYIVKREAEICGDNEGNFNWKKTLWKSKTLPINFLIAMKQHKKIIEKEEIDIVISDSSYSPLYSAKILKKKVFLIINQNKLNEENSFYEFINKIFLKVYGFGIESFTDKVIVPDFYPPNHICEYHLEITQKTDFIGPLIRYDPSEYNCSKEIVFCTFGGEPFKLPLYYKLKEIADQNKDLHFVVACGLEEVKGLNSENFEVHSYIKDVDKYLCRAKATILHGGLTSIHETLCFGKAPLILYDEKHPEQKNNALKIEKMNAGKIANPRKSDLEEIKEKLFEVFDIDNSKFKKMYLKNQNGKKNMLKIIEKN